MKWGVRRTPEELGHYKKKTSAVVLSVKPTKTVSGHSPTPKQSDPGDIIDHISHDGKIDVRTFYDKDGKKSKDVHTTAHGNPKMHNYGEKGEHVVTYEWNEDGSIKNKFRRELTDNERKENKDIL